MTPLQNKVYLYVRDHIIENGHAPTYRQILKDCEFKSTSQVWEIVNSLTSMGYLRKGRHHSTDLGLGKPNMEAVYAAATNFVNSIEWHDGKVVCNTGAATALCRAVAHG